MGPAGAAERPVEDKVDLALRHLMVCPVCRAEMGPEERGRFAHAAALGRE
jgi:hypothetical protein